ncbi:hypothetical protein DCAR_0100096 [Daucus carota subsp. sativus]|uniref:Ycf15 n=1 Tax=Daucus carota subsp. sativus TaxID=79200 RepID=A0AAF0VZ23_DAUCS|nr:hypothetical protein DCAR_0100060 [Daucus carota subsp. sativus]WOG80951.1 hypothetical protein DCAR_0100096 [Daucus carota subsp. sativus]
MRVQLHCIARIHVTGANSSSRKKRLTKPGSLTNLILYNIILENTNIIEKNCISLQHNIGHRKDLGDPPKHESQDLS